MQIGLGELQKVLSLISDDEALLDYGFNNPHSYRGMYDCVAFEPSNSPVTVGELKGYVEKALSEQYTGWKGGDYTYHESTPIFFAEKGCTEEGAGCFEHKLTLPIRQYWFTLVTAMHKGQPIDISFHY